MGGPPRLTGERPAWEDNATRGRRRTTEEERELAAAVVRRVVVCVDRSEIAERALPHAISIAGALGGEPPRVLHVIEPQRPSERLAPADAFDWEVRRAEARRYLELIFTPHRALDSPLKAELIEGRAAEQIRDWVEDHEIDLTVLCSHGTSGRTEWSLASTAKKLIEGVSGSVMLVPAWSVRETPRDDVRYTRILVPLDGSPRAECALPLANRVARKHGAALELVHVVPVPELTRVSPLAPEDVELEQKLIERNERVGRRYLDQLRTRLSERGLRVRAVLARGRDIRCELLRITSDSHADLVVLSSHGHGGRTERPLGSVAGHLAEHCTTPLLIVRERSRRIARRPEAPKGRGPGIALTTA